jgi:hypothetical protein
MADITAKPGVKTSEFYVTLAANAIAILVLFGFIDQADQGGIQSSTNEIIASVFATITNVSYIISRGILKKS